MVSWAQKFVLIFSINSVVVQCSTKDRKHFVRLALLLLLESTFAGYQFWEKPTELKMIREAFYVATCARC